MFYREFLLISYDYEYALSTSIPARTLDYILSLLISVTTLVCVYTVGVFVTYAMLMIPRMVLIKTRLRVSNVIILSIITIFTSLIFSLLVSYVFELAPSGLCGLTLCLICVLTYVIMLIASRK